MFGKEWQDNAGTLYCIDDKLKVSPKLTGITISNGLAWRGKTMYYIDTMTLRIDAYDYDASTASLSNKRAVYTFPADKSFGLPDGMTLDADGNIWVACFNVRAVAAPSFVSLARCLLRCCHSCSPAPQGQRVLQINAATGAVMTNLVMPTHQVTAVAFGGPGLSELYVTTAREDLKAHHLRMPKFRHGGRLFVVKGLGVAGLPAHEWRVDVPTLRAAQAQSQSTRVVAKVAQQFTPHRVRSKAWDQTAML